MRIIGTLILGLFLSASAIAQVCTPDPNATTIGASPATMEVGTVGTTYEQFLTVVFPTDTLGYPLVSAVIDDVSLPEGLNWECGTPDCQYNPSVNAQACIRIFGTPASLGTFTVVINSTLGIQGLNGFANQASTILEIAAAQNGLSNEGFSTSTGTGCAPLNVSFLNNNPGMDGYQWNFGNGHSHWGENPENVTYEEPGEYIVSYTAYGNADTTYTYTLNTINLTYVEQSLWYMALFDMNPKFYITIYEEGRSGFVYQSTSPANTPNGRAPREYNNINLNLDPTKTYRVEVYEYDQADADDNCGAHTISFPFVNGSSVIPSTSTINWNITATPHMPTSDMIIRDTIRVYGATLVPEITYENGTLSAITEETVTYQWILDGVAIEGATETTYTPTTSGYYTVVVANQGGCTETSIEVLVAICLTDYTPVITVSDLNTLEIENALANHSIHWYVNNNEITGTQNSVMPITSSGAYSVILTDIYGCSYSSTVQNAFLSVNDLDIANANAYPNPTTGKLTITAQNTILSIEIVDAAGRSVMNTIENTTSTDINISNLPNGYYIVKIQTENGLINKNIVKN